MMQFDAQKYTFSTHGDLTPFIAKMVVASGGRLVSAPIDDLVPGDFLPQPRGRIDQPEIWHYDCVRVHRFAPNWTPRATLFFPSDVADDDPYPWAWGRPGVMFMYDEDQRRQPPPFLAFHLGTPWDVVPWGDAERDILRRVNDATDGMVGAAIEANARTSTNCAIYGACFLHWWRGEEQNAPESRQRRYARMMENES